MDQGAKRRGRPPAPPQVLPLFLHQGWMRTRQEVTMSTRVARELRSYVEWAATVTRLPAEEVALRVIDHALEAHFKRDKRWQQEQREAAAAIAAKVAAE